MNDGPLLDVRGLTRTYERAMVTALVNVSFQAEAGEMVAITGPSGCGKSTLLGLIGLLDRPTHGVIRLAGQDLAGIAQPSRFRAEKLGFVFQFHHLVSSMTLLENVAAPMAALGLPVASRRERARELLDRMGLLSRGHFLPARVSGGERQRAAVARAVANHPALILADEPTGNLDSRNGEVVMDLLAREGARGTLVLIATHNPEVAARATREIRLRDGRLAG